VEKREVIAEGKGQRAENNKRQKAKDHINE
jgi:hypothetical protein